MHLAPFGDDAATPANHTGQPFDSIMDVLQTNTAMNRKVVHSLFALFDKGITEKFPGEIFRFAMHLFHRLIDRDRTDRNGAVADNPFPGLMDMISRRQVHQCITTPFTTPYRFLHFFFYI